MALAVAIPYTDVVVTEEFFAGVAYQQDLPKRLLTENHHLGELDLEPSPLREREKPLVAEQRQM
ncbi:hypothetical protein [Natrinema sp. DC36]|uniref:hypothetical protein n=1 Tax=Natrinema sp. DC36 TaxID=2878680 RepID=UPI001CF0A9B5|nr:hypothetical protein [Natrinema sp. DC36]